MYAIEYFRYWSDSPDDWGALDGADGSPVLFETRELAQEYIDLEVAKQQAVRDLKIKEGEDYIRPRMELYNRRVEVLKEAGLWRSELDNVSPLVVPASPNFLGLPEVDTYRVVSEEELSWYDF